MPNTHKTFSLPDFSEREHRLAFEAPPETGSGIREQQEELRPTEQIVHDKLEQVTRLDEEKRKLLYDDLWTRFMIEASVGMQGGKRVQWMPPRLVETAAEWHPAFRDAEKKFTEIKAANPKQASRLLDAIRDQLKAWEAAQEGYKKAFAGDLEADLNATIQPHVTKALGVLTANSGTLYKDFKPEEDVKLILDSSETFRKMKPDEKLGDKIAAIKAELVFDAKAILQKHAIEQAELVKRMDAILVRMRDALAETDADKIKRIATLERQITELRAKGGDTKDLEKQLDYAKLSSADKIKELEREWKEELSLSEPDGKKIEVVIRALTQRLQNVQQQKNEFLRAHALPRRKYLLKFGGYNAEWLVGQSEISDGKYNPRMLELDLRVMGFNPDIVELETRRNDKAKLMEYVLSLEGIEKDDATGVEKKVRFTGNDAGISLYQMYLRSQFPESVTDQLRRPDLQNASAGLLFELSALDPTKPFQDNLKAIIQMCTQEEDGKTVVLKDRFVQVVTFLSYTKAGAKAHEDFNNVAGRKEEDKRSFAKDAEAKFQELVTNGTLEAVAGKFLVKGAELPAIDKAKNTALQAEIDSIKKHFADGTKKNVLGLVGDVLVIANGIPEFAALPATQPLTADIASKIIAALEAKKARDPKASETLEKAITAQGVTWSPDALDMIKEMKASGADTRKLTTSMEMLWSETKGTTVGAAKVWWEYVKTLPNIAYDPTQDKKILEFIKQQDALTGARSALVNSSSAFKALDSYFTGLDKQLQNDKEAMRQAVLPLDIAADAKSHYDSANTLSNAAFHLIKRLNAKHGWAQRPLEIRKISFWLAMNKGSDGLALADGFLTEASRVERDDTRRKLFIDDYIKKLPDDDRTALLQYLGQFSRMQELSKTDILAEASNRDIRVKRDALMVLENLGHAGKLGRWHIDDPTTEPYIEESLRAILHGAGAEALITAFLTKSEQEYEFNGVKQIISAEDANLYVQQIQNDLTYKSEQEVAAEKQNKEYDMLGDPIEKNLRSVAETLGELWQGDMVDKAKVIAAIVAGLWLMKSAWQKGGLGKKILVGLPLLMVANTVYRKETGKDLLGQNLTYMSQQQRGTALERFRRRGAAIDEYKVLGTPAGVTALAQLTSRGNPITLQELIAWREQVKSPGYRDYTKGAPKNLNTMAIWTEMGKKGEMNDAYEVAFLAFEALCVDVAQLNGIGGDYKSAAEQGADFIKKNYIDMTEYAVGDPRRDMAGRPITMLDVIINEARTPGTEDAITEDRTFIEWVAGAIGQSTEYVRDKLRQGYSWAELKKEQVAEKVPEYLETGKEFALNTYANVEEWARITWEKFKPEAIEGFQASWRLLFETGKSVGITIVTHGPGMVEWGVSGAANLSIKTVEALRKMHATLLQYPEMNWVESFEEFVLDTFGYDVLEELDQKEAEKQILLEEEALALMLSDGTYAISDVKNPNSISAINPTKKSEFVKVTDGTGKHISLGAVKLHLETAKSALAKDVFGKDYKALPPASKRYILELASANIFDRMLATGDFAKAASEYNKKEADAQRDVEIQEKTVASVQESIKTTDEELKRLEKKYSMAWEHTAAQLGKEHDIVLQQHTAKDREAKNNLQAITDLKKIDVTKLSAWDLHWHTQKMQSTEKKQIELDAQVLALTKELAAIDVYILIARAGAPRTPAGVGTKVIPGLRGAMQISAFNDAVQIHKDYEAAKLNRGNLDATLATAQDSLAEARQALRNVTLTPVDLPADKLFSGWKTDVFDVPPVDRQNDMLKPAFFEPPNLLGSTWSTVVLEKMFSDAKVAALAQLDTWVTHRLANDALYQRMKRDAKEPELLAKYEKYLRHVAGNELFIRILLKSRDGGLGEKSHAVHLSMSEGRQLDEFLRERGRLVSFAQFYENELVKVVK
jgi:hypothetical protein